MSKRIEYLWESPCFRCCCDYECERKITNSPNIGVIKDNIFGDTDFDYHKCGIWIALNAPEMVEVNE